jgi:hypothetical protein
MWTWHGYNVVDGLVALFLLAGLLGGSAPRIFR